MADRFWREPLEEASDGAFIGQSIQSQQGKEKPIVLKLVGFVDALDTCDQKEQKHQDQIHWIEVGPIRSSDQSPLKPTSQIKLVTKTLN